jgi:hypothetical protein
MQVDSNGDLVLFKDNDDANRDDVYKPGYVRFQGIILCLQNVLRVIQDKPAPYLQ